MRVLIVMAASAIVAGAAAAQERDSSGVAAALARLGISGSVRGAYWSSDRELSDREHYAAGSLWLKTSGRSGDRFAYLAEGWMAWSGNTPGGRWRDAAEVREAYVEDRLGDVDIRVGRQVIAWGRADGINPTDRLSPKDRRTLVPDDDDRRLGADAARATWYTGPVAITALWLPAFRADRVGLPAGMSGAVEERSDWSSDSWATRLERVGGAVDFSISYARIRDVGPDLVLHDDGGPPWLELAHHPVRMIGADIAGNVGRYGLRAEAAYLHTIDADGTDPFAKNREFSLVGGGDRTFGGTVNVNVQYLFKYVFDHDASTVGSGTVAWHQRVLSGQAARVQHGATARVGAKWFHDTFEADLSGAAYFGPRGTVVRPKLTYAVTDQVRVTAGAEIYRGDDAALFGLMRANSAGFVEFRYVF
jgi:hypothetical protein